MTHAHRHLATQALREIPKNRVVVVVPRQKLFIDLDLCFDNLVTFHLCTSSEQGQHMGQHMVSTGPAHGQHRVRAGSAQGQHMVSTGPVPAGPVPAGPVRAGPVPAPCSAASYCSSSKSSFKSTSCAWKIGKCSAMSANSSSRPAPQHAHTFNRFEQHSEKYYCVCKEDTHARARVCVCVCVGRGGGGPLTRINMGVGRHANPLHDKSGGRWPHCKCDYVAKVTALKRVTALQRWLKVQQQMPEGGRGLQVQRCKGGVP